MAAFLDAQPGNVQAAFQYCLALTMVHTGHAELLQTTSGESGPLCTFKTTSGESGPLCAFKTTAGDVYPSQACDQ